MKIRKPFVKFVSDIHLILYRISFAKFYSFTVEIGQFSVISRAIVPLPVHEFVAKFCILYNLTWFLNEFQLLWS